MQQTNTNVFHTLVMVKLKPLCRKSHNKSSLPYMYNWPDLLKNRTLQTPPVPGGPVWLVVTNMSSNSCGITDGSLVALGTWVKKIAM